MQLRTRNRMPSIYEDTPTPSHDSFPRAANPAPAPSTDDGIRTPNLAAELSALPGCVRERTKQGNRPEQQLHHFVWPPSHTENNTQYRQPLNYKHGIIQQFVNYLMVNLTVGHFGDGCHFVSGIFR